MTERRWPEPEERKRLIHSKTPGYNTWRLMISRCHNPKAKDYSRYGKKGIRVCDRWRFGEDGMHGFACFHQDMGEPPVGFTLDRRENSKGYERSNCRWADRFTQQRNKPNNYFSGGVDPKAVCRKHGVNYKTFRNRISRGASIEEALRPRKTELLTDGGKPLKEIADETGIPYRTLVDRWKAGCRGAALLVKRTRSDFCTKRVNHG